MHAISKLQIRAKAGNFAAAQRALRCPSRRYSGGPASVAFLDGVVKPMQYKMMTEYYPEQIAAAHETLPFWRWPKADSNPATEKFSKWCSRFCEGSNSIPLAVLRCRLHDFMHAPSPMPRAGSQSPSPSYVRVMSCGASASDGPGACRAHAGHKPHPQ